jgi:hypothetical protein
MNDLTAINSVAAQIETPPSNHPDTGSSIAGRSFLGKGFWHLSFGILIGTAFLPAVAWGCSGAYVSQTINGTNFTANPAAANGTVLGSYRLTISSPSVTWRNCFGPSTHAGVSAYNATYRTFVGRTSGL